MINSPLADPTAWRAVKAPSLGELEELAQSFEHRPQQVRRVAGA